MAAGVGKTVRMLDDAHAMRRAGVDIVIGLVETHGRAETAARIADLEVIPRAPGLLSRRGHRRDGSTRRPDAPARTSLVVDELPHTNAPGSKNEKRWQDVEEILAAGISVMTAINVQHLEGVQDIVRSATGIDIRERVPDRIVREADSVILVDLPVAELQERLRAGKDLSAGAGAARARKLLSHGAARAAFASSRCCRPRHFPARRVVVQASAELRLAVALPFEPEIAQAARPPRIAPGRPHEHALVRRLRPPAAARIPKNISAEQHRKLSENVQLAISLGATVVTRESEDVVGALLDFVESEGITMLVVGRPTRSGLVSRVVPSTVHRLLERGRGFDIVIVDVLTEADRIPDACSFHRRIPSTSRTPISMTAKDL